MGPVLRYIDIVIWHPYLTTQVEDACRPCGIANGEVFS